MQSLSIVDVFDEDADRLAGVVEITIIAAVYLLLWGALGCTPSLRHDYLELAAFAVADAAYTAIRVELLKMRRSDPPCRVTQL
jgi:hypothetical protein